MPPTRADILDRTLAVVNGRLITLSDLRLEKTLQEILNGKASEDDAVVVRRMIERFLIEAQMAQFPGIEVTPQEIDSHIARIPDLKGLPVSQVREAVRSRLRIVRFFDLRFRQFIQTTDEEVRDYYNRTFVPEAQARRLESIPAVEEVAETIRKIVIEEKLNREIQAWIESMMRRSTIEIFE